MIERIRLDPKKPGRSEEELKKAFRELMVNQDRAINHLVRKLLYANSLDGRLRNHRKPAGSFMYLGPTGVGKTRLVEVLAYLMFGAYDAMIKIDCSELQERHEISRLIGAPPGYVGYNDEPYLSQRRLDYWGYLTEQTDPEVADRIKELHDRIEALQTRVKEFEEKSGAKQGAKMAAGGKPPPELAQLKEELGSLDKAYTDLTKKHNYRPGAYPAILLFDEIEKANKSLFDLLLQVHDKANLTLHGTTRDGNNRVFFHNTLIFYTSNIAQRQIRRMLRNSGIGFAPATVSVGNLDQEIYKTALGQMEKFFSPEFLGRIGKENFIVFSPLIRSDIREGLDRIVIPNFMTRLTGTFPISLTITERAREFLVDESFDSKNKAFGMRAVEGAFLKRVEENFIALIQKSVEEGGIVAGDDVLADVTDGKLEFSAKSRSESQKILAELTGKIERKITEFGVYTDDRKRVATFKFRKT
ncbi:MAG: ATP-dependent Clp protease ATP-binding subunit [Candidatus Yanofskybacteria bacterium]|nr:ATP-dependent Clp protease ATP-binding subunit [Candidatus Yanofskybacteria bacterium]MBI2594788.1 ATP-dependent Clp protease ATP-binding subunit [Candidatus Colwellbacteria bacterium]